MIVIDASVAVKWFVTEVGLVEAEALVASSEAKAAPEYILSEVAQALLRHHHAGRLGIDYCRASLSRLRRVINLHPVEAFADRALTIAAETRCSVYDTLYLAAAERWDAGFVTADIKLVNRLVGTSCQRRVRSLAGRF